MSSFGLLSADLGATRFRVGVVVVGPDFSTLTVSEESHLVRVGDEPPFLPLARETLLDMAACLVRVRRDAEARAERIVPIVALTTPGAAVTHARPVGAAPSAAGEEEEEGGEAVHVADSRDVASCDDSPKLPYRLDVATLPNFPSLASLDPSVVLGDELRRLDKKEYSVFVTNDAYAQGLSAGRAYLGTHRLLAQQSVVLMHLGPGTGLGSCLMLATAPKERGDEPDIDVLCHLYDVGVRPKRPGDPFPDPISASSGDDEKLLIADTLLGGRALERILSAAPASVEASKLSAAYRDNLYPDLLEFLRLIRSGKAKKKFQAFDLASSVVTDPQRRVVVLLSGIFANDVGRKTLLPLVRENAELQKQGFEFWVPAAEESQSRNTLEAAVSAVPRQVLLRASVDLTLGRPRIQIAARLAAEVDTIRKKLTTERAVRVCIDGYCGVDFGSSTSPESFIGSLVGEIRKAVGPLEININALDFRDCFRSEDEISSLLAEGEGLGPEKVFGRIFQGRFSDLLDAKRVEEFKLRMKKQTSGVVVVFGHGASSLSEEKEKEKEDVFDVVCWRDLTREEIGRRCKVMPERMLVLGQRDAAAGPDTKRPSYLAKKRYHYVDFPLMDIVRKNVLSASSGSRFYLDENCCVGSYPVLVPVAMLKSALDRFTSAPFTLKPYYDSGVWGGQWLKRVRPWIAPLPHLKVNCAWAYEIMAYQQSLVLPIIGAKSKLEVPFAAVLDLFGRRIMGERIASAFGDYFPTRVNYDDCFKGGDMAVQIHPDRDYIKNFGEPLHQDESYYIMDADEGAYVHLGLRDGISLDDFHEKCRDAEEKGVAFNHKEYVNVVPAKKGDLFLIPAGTVHASGSGCVVLELSATTDRYTFHFYDYLRKDHVHGGLRDIHLKRAFTMARKYPDRRESFVKDSLCQQPRLLREGPGWKEFVIGQLDYIVFAVHRCEFDGEIPFDTAVSDSYHILSLVDGPKRVLVMTDKGSYVLRYSESVIVPRSAGRYRVVRADNDPPCEGPVPPCVVLKILPNVVV